MYHDKITMRYKLDENGALIFITDKNPKSNENLYLKTLELEERIEKLEESIEKMEAENVSKE